MKLFNLHSDNGPGWDCIHDKTVLYRLREGLYIIIKRKEGKRSSD